MIKNLFLLFSLFVMALPTMANNHIGAFPKDNVIAKQIGINFAEIVLSADSIVADLTVWENDTLPKKVLPPCKCSIVQYTLCQPIMYSTDKRVYSAFYADARLLIYKGKTFLTLELDYNINKWRLLDESGKQICRHDLKNSELLSLLHEIWPENKNINIKYEKFAE